MSHYCGGPGLNPPITWLYHSAARILHGVEAR